MKIIDKKLLNEVSAQARVSPGWCLSARKGRLWRMRWRGYWKLR